MLVFSPLGSELRAADNNVQLDEATLSTYDRLFKRRVSAGLLGLTFLVFVYHYYHYYHYYYYYRHHHHHHYYYYYYYYYCTRLRIIIFLWYE